MTAAMCSPNFLFRVETMSARRTKATVKSATPNGDEHRASRDVKTAALKTAADGASDKYLLNDFALASRLSYFLWSSMPDDELFALAAQRQTARHRTCWPRR